MPHKRAKASIRKSNSLSMGFDLPPDQELNQKKERNNKKKKNQMNKLNQSKDLSVSKNMFRILNAEKIRLEYNLKKKKLNNYESLSPKTLKTSNQKFNQLNKISSSSNYSFDELKILPGEGLGKFNHRVEETLRHKVNAVFKAAKKNQSSNEVNDKTIKEKKSIEKISINNEYKTKKQENNNKIIKLNQIKNFQSKPTKFPLSKTVNEPPNLKPSKFMNQNLNSISSNLDRLPISLAQKRIMTLERDNAIERYRKIKQEKFNQNLI